MNAVAENELTFKGVIRKIIYEKDDYKILSFFTNDKQDLTLVGSLYGVTEDEEIKVSGKWETHPKFGKQFVVQWWERDIPSTKEGVLAYLASPLVKGCGKKKAKRIVDKLGVQCIEEITTKGHKVLLSITGIGEKQAISIYESIVATFEVQSVMKELIPLGLTPNVINRIFREYKGGAIQVVQENPYQLTRLALIGFQKADEIARKVEISPLMPYRIESCIEYTLNENIYGSGHCFLPEAELIEKTVLALNHPFEKEIEELKKELTRPKTTYERRLEIKERIQWIEQNFVDVSLVAQAMIDLAGQEIIINEQGCIYPKHIYTVETELAERIVNKMKTSIPTVKVEKIEKAIQEYEKEEGITLAQGQKDGIIAIMTHPLTILTGGAGTGKTTVTKGVIYCYKKLYPDVKIGLSAPTGRASRKLGETTGMDDAKTIHRQIGFRQGEAPEFNESNPLEFTLLLLDEFSMADAPLSLLLFRAIQPSARVVLVGDPDQLPSVGVGAVLKDMIQAGVPHVKLTEIFRQALESQIVTNSHRINKGQQIVIDPNKEDFFFIPKAEQNEIADTIRRSVLRFLQKGYTLDDIMILSPMNNGVIGVKGLNKMLQSVLNPPAPEKEEMEKFGTVFRKGDKVIQLKNNGDKKVYNGDIGFIRYIGEVVHDEDEKEKMLEVDFGDRTVMYTQEELEELQLAYCISIHKSQGGQAPIVIIPMSTSHFIMLVRNLLYTGVTRAEKILVLIGMMKAVNIAIRNNKTTKRNTRLQERIRNLVENLG